MRCRSRSLEDVLRAEAGGFIVLFIDEIDAAPSLPFSRGAAGNARLALCSPMQAARSLPLGISVGDGDADGGCSLAAEQNAR
jgi:hypothetical protein